MERSILDMVIDNDSFLGYTTVCKALLLNRGLVPWLIM